MRIILSAGIHDNPVHRQRLKRLFSELVEKRCKPSFVAVEANRALFHSVIQRQRDVFVSMTQKDQVWTALKKNVLQDLSMAIGYEADAHVGIFPEEPQTVWLDDNRLDFSTACDPCSTAKRCLLWYRKAVDKCGLAISNSTTAEELFKAIDAFMTQSVDKQRPSGPYSASTFHRDHAWMAMLKNMLTDQVEPCAIIVVGADHAQNKPDYLRYLLGKAGHNCEVQSLVKEPRQIT